MVTNYINNFCKYRLDKLQNVVYLISETALRTIEIDVPIAFVSGITEPPIALKTTSISLTEDDTLDERYEFTHTLSFTVDGYANYTDFQGRYYAIVKNYEGKYWLLNPLFPSKLTYEYTLDASGSRTEFTMATASNHPTLLAVGFDAPTPYECNGYNLCGIDRLFLNEKAYSNVDNNGRIYYTNDGFKEVVFDKNSATFKEIFNGDTVQHQIDFNIKFDDYKSSWHYNLLEFVDNTYSSVISTKCGTYIMSGFNFGLQPSFSVSADETTTPNNIGITLVDAANSGSFINLVSGTSFNPITTTEWIYTSENDGWECVGNGIAMYLLKKEVDAFGNPSGHYLAYSGYTSYFEEKGLIIDGEFDEQKTFISSECVESGCTLSTSLLNTIKMRPQTCTLFELQCDSDWDITSSSSFLLFNPSSGVANSAYTVEICNNVSQSSLSVSGEFSINYCNNKHFDVTVQISKQIDTCFPQGQEFNINALAQWVNIPTNCCVDTVENSAITNVQIGNGWVKVYVPQNFTFTARTFTLVFTMCNGTTVDVIINQDRIYERWVSAGLVCRLTQQCTLLKRYTGLTPSSIDTYTYETQFVDCAPSPDCSNGSYWVQTTATTCDNGRKYYVEEEMIWDGTSWVASGNQRIGAETEDSPAECSGGTPTYEYRWVLTDEWECNGTTKRYLYKYQQRISGSSDAWSDVVPTRTSYNGEGTMAESAITNSTDCGYVPPVEPQYKWVRMDITTDYICDECPTPQYRTLTTATTCVGVDKYELDEYQVSYDSGTTWTTTATSATTLIEANSTDCGYSARTLTTGWTCQGYDKYGKAEYQVSYDSGVTWTTTATSATTLIEANSSDCGYIPPLLDIKFYATYSDNTSYSAECESETGLTYADVTPNGYVRSAMTSAVIGDCISGLNYYNYSSISGNVTSGTFQLCTSLTSATISNSVKTIGEYAFNSCSGLTRINSDTDGVFNIPEGVLSIRMYAFAHCPMLKHIVFPSTVTYMEVGTVSYSNNIESITILATTPPNTDSWEAPLGVNRPIYVPSGSVQAYKTAKGWSGYSSYIQAIPNS